MKYINVVVIVWNEAMLITVEGLLCTSVRTFHLWHTSVKASRYLCFVFFVFLPDVQKHLPALRQNLFLEENTLKPQSVLLTTVWLWSLERVGI